MEGGVEPGQGGDQDQSPVGEQPPVGLDDLFISPFDQTALVILSGCLFGHVVGTPARS